MSVKQAGMEPIPENLNSTSSIFGEETGIMELEY